MVPEEKYSDNLFLKKYTIYNLILYIMGFDGRYGGIP